MFSVPKLPGEETSRLVDAQWRRFDEDDNNNNIGPFKIKNKKRKMNEFCFCFLARLLALE